jgi:beta-glucanase (GH16 family)
VSTLPRGPLLLALCGTVLLVLMGTASAYILFDSPVAGADDGPAGAPGPTGSPTPTVPAGLATVQGARATNPPPSPVGAASGGPSGVAMPQGDLPNWKQVFADDFNGTSLAKGWGAYNAEISSTPGGLWKDSHVRVQDGKLQLLGYREGDRWVTGGLMNNGPATTLYGKYEVRFRADNANGVKYAILLWPDSNKWPDDGEIDFAEDGGGVRDGFSATVHFVTDGGGHETIQRNVKNDFSIWHTVGVEWSPGTLVYTLDGRPWTTVNTSHTPSKPMNLVIQTEAATTCGQWMTCVDATTPATVAVEVDWVTAYVHR